MKLECEHGFGKIIIYTGEIQRRNECCDEEAQDDQPETYVLGRRRVGAVILLDCLFYCGTRLWALTLFGRCCGFGRGSRYILCALGHGVDVGWSVSG